MILNPGVVLHQHPVTIAPALDADTAACRVIDVKGSNSAGIGEGMSTILDCR